MTEREKAAEEVNIMKERKIVFVCTGNTCRSPMAEAVLRSELKRLHIDDVSVYSAGIRATEGGYINPNSLAVLTENGLSVENFSPTPLDRQTLETAFAIVCMTDEQRDLLMEMRWTILRREGFSEIENNVYSFSELAGEEIPDPFGREIGVYRQTYRKIAAGIPALIGKLLSEPEAEENVKTEERAENREEADRIPTEKKPTKRRAKPRKKMTRNADGKRVAVRTTKKSGKTTGKTAAKRKTTGKTRTSEKRGKNGRKNDG